MTSVPRSLWRHTGTPLDAAPLMHLLGATKPDRVDAALVAAFRGRHEGVAQGKKKQIQADMGGITEQETDALLSSLTHLIHSFLYLGVQTKEGVFDLLPSDFHTSLRSLLAKLLLARLVEWRDTILSDSVGPPKLVDFDWRVDLISSSNHLSHLSSPTVLVDMNLQPPATSTQLIAPLESVNFELTPGALTTLLNGLEKIQSQLSTMK